MLVVLVVLVQVVRVVVLVVVVLHTGGLEDPGVALAVAGCEGLHHPVDLLGLAGQPETPQELSVRGRKG